MEFKTSFSDALRRHGPSGQRRDQNPTLEIDDSPTLELADPPKTPAADDWVSRFAGDSHLSRVARTLKDGPASSNNPTPPDPDVCPYYSEGRGLCPQKPGSQTRRVCQLAACPQPYRIPQDTPVAPGPTDDRPPGAPGNASYQGSPAGMPLMSRQPRTPGTR